jgi:PKD repeat protein
VDAADKSRVRILRFPLLFLVVVPAFGALVSSVMAPVRLGVRSLLLGTVLVLGLVIAPAAQAGWLAPVAISQGGGVPQVVLDAQGNATAVWQSWNGEDTVVESAYRPAGGSWQTPVDLSQASGEVTLVAGEHDAGSPRIAVDGKGDITVVWERWGGTNRIIIEVAYRPAGGSWQTPVNVGEVQTEWDPAPWVAVDERGDTTVVWNDEGVIESAYQPAGGSWEAPVAVSGADEAFVPRAAVDAQGDATVVWMSYDGSRYVVQSAYRPAGGSWETPTELSEAGENGGDPEIALDSSGDTMVVWDGHSGENGTTEVVHAAYRPAGGEWQAPADLSAAGVLVEGNELRVALGTHGEAIVTWSAYGGSLGGYDIVQAAYRPAGAGWQAPVNLSENGGNAFPTDLTFDQEGNAVVVWERESVVQADYRPAGGEWQQPASLGDGDDAVVVLDAPGDSTAADGDATAVWTSGGTIQAAGYDAVEPPQTIEAPATGEAGTPVSVAVPAASPLEVYSPLLSFGDGTSAAATTSATHTYAAPGKYTVTFSSTDVLGYASSTQQTIVIGPHTSKATPPETGTTETATTDTTGPASSTGDVTGSVAADTLTQPSTSPKPPPLGLELGLAKRTLRAILRTKAIHIVCHLSVPGTCAVRASFGPGHTTLAGHTTLNVAGAKIVTIELTREALAELRDTGRLVLTLTATASTTGHRTATTTSTLLVR